MSHVGADGQRIKAVATEEGRIVDSKIVTSHLKAAVGVVVQGVQPSAVCEGEGVQYL